MKWRISYWSKVDEALYNAGKTTQSDEGERSFKFQHKKS